MSHLAPLVGLDRCPVANQLEILLFRTEGAAEKGIELHKDGFVLVGDLLQLPCIGGACVRDVECMVEADSRRLFSLKRDADGHLMLRTNHGYADEASSPPVQKKMKGAGAAGAAGACDGAGAGAGACESFEERVNDGLHVKLFNDFLTSKQCTSLQCCLQSYIDCNGLYFTKYDERTGSKCGLAFGNADLTAKGYATRIGAVRKIRPVASWDDGELGQAIRDIGQQINRQLGAKSFEYCVVQRYDSTRPSIAPHRDNEQDSETGIYGLSIGATYRLTMRHGVLKDNRQLTVPREWLHDAEHKEKLDLPNGSLYVLEPPTNDSWSHQIHDHNKTKL